VLVDDDLLLKDFGLNGIIFINVCYSRCYGNAVKVSGALWEIYDVVTAFDFPVILDGQRTSTFIKITHSIALAITDYFMIIKCSVVVHH
jgi:hypothetical protein